MNRRRLLKLWANKEILDYINDCARRHFPNITDQEIASDNAWKRIEEMRKCTDIKKVAYNAIHGMYERRRRYLKKCT